MNRNLVGGLMFLCAAILFAVAATGGAHATIDIVVGVLLGLTGIVMLVQEFLSRRS